jgi:hypothetical protein
MPSSKSATHVAPAKVVTRRHEPRDKSETSAAPAAEPSHSRDYMIDPFATKK